MLQRNEMCLVKLFCRCQYMLFHNFGKIIKSNKINVKKIYSPSDVHCLGGRLEYPSSVTDFFFLSCSLRSLLRQEKKI